MASSFASLIHPGCSTTTVAPDTYTASTRGQETGLIHWNQKPVQLLVSAVAIRREWVPRNSAIEKADQAASSDVVAPVGPRDLLQVLQARSWTT